MLTLRAVPVLYYFKHNSCLCQYLFNIFLPQPPYFVVFRVFVNSGAFHVADIKSAQNVKFRPLNQSKAGDYSSALRFQIISHTTKNTVTDNVRRFIFLGICLK